MIGMDITLPSTLNKGTRRSVMSLKTAFQLHVTLYYEKTAGVGGIIKDMKTMKKPIVVTTLIVLSALFVCCSKSPEEKIEIMIGELVKNNLYIPESYDPVQTRVDSAFAPYDDPEFREFIVKSSKKLDEAYTELKSCEFDIESAVSSMETWEDFWYDSHRLYNKAKKEYAENVALKSEIEKEITEIKSEIKDWIETEPKFIGYKAAHSYRAETNAGYTLFGGIVCLFDKECTQIIAAYDVEDDDYTTFIDFMERIDDGEIDLNE